MRIGEITADDVDEWHAQLLPYAPTRRAHTYALLAAIMRTAATGRSPVIAESPCQIPHAAKVVRRFEPKPATPEQIAVIVENMPDKYSCLLYTSRCV